MYILLAEDDKRLGKLIVHMLKKENHTVDWVQDGSDAMIYAQSSTYDLIILDWMMPKKDGIEVCKQLRKSRYQGAILMLTAKDAVNDRVEGLDSGADDYLVKPFEFAELFARIRAISRRAEIPISPTILHVGDLELDLNTYKVTKKGMDIQLTPREFQLLEIFMINAGQVLTRELLLDRIWGLDANVSDNNLDALVRLLRKKVDYDKDHQLIFNIRGVGYRLENKNVS